MLSVSCGWQVLLVVLAVSAQYATSYLLARWADATASGVTGAASTRAMALYVGVAVGFGALVGVRGVSAALFFVRSSRALHAGMLHGVLHQPMRFFDTQPIGRILNRFSMDTLNFDVTLPRLWEGEASACSMAAAPTAVARGSALNTASSNTCSHP